MSQTTLSNYKMHGVSTIISPCASSVPYKNVPGLPKLLLPDTAGLSITTSMSGTTTMPGDPAREFSK